MYEVIGDDDEEEEEDDEDDDGEYFLSISAAKSAILLFCVRCIPSISFGVLVVLPR